MDPQPAPHARSLPQPAGARSRMDRGHGLAPASSSLPRSNPTGEELLRRRAPPGACTPLLPVPSFPSSIERRGAPASHCSTAALVPVPDLLPIQMSVAPFFSFLCSSRFSLSHLSVLLSLSTGVPRAMASLSFARTSASSLHRCGSASPAIPRTGPRRRHARPLPSSCCKAKRGPLDPLLRPLPL